MKRLFLLLLVATTLLFFFFTNKPSEISDALYVSNFSLYDAVKHIAPQDVAVESLTPLGQDLHAFKPTPKTVKTILESKHFFYLSKGMDRWVDDIAELKTQKNTTDLSNSVSWMRLDHEHVHEGEHEHEHEHEHEKNSKEDFFVDPHYWFDIDNQIKLSYKIEAIVSELFPDKKTLIEMQAKSYRETLEQLKQTYKTSLRSCKEKSLFVTHDAFGYLEKAYAFEIVSIVGISPESQPDPAKFASIIEQLKKDKVSKIFFEHFISDKMAKVIAKEAGVEVDMLHTLATVSKKEFETKNYTLLMLENLAKISEALDCQ